MTTEEDRKKAEEEEKKRLLKERELLKDYKRTFNTEYGKRVFMDLIERCHIFHSTFTGNSRGMFLEGERHVGLYLIDRFYPSHEEALKELDSIK